MNFNDIINIVNKLGWVCPMELKEELFNAIKEYVDTAINKEVEKRIKQKERMEKDKAHEDMLLKHGFEPVSQEDIKDRLDDIFFWDP